MTLQSIQCTPYDALYKGIPPTHKQKNTAAVTAAAATAVIPLGWRAGGHGLGIYVDIYRNV